MILYKQRISNATDMWEQYLSPGNHAKALSDNVHNRQITRFNEAVFSYLKCSRNFDQNEINSN